MEKDILKIINRPVSIRNTLLYMGISREEYVKVRPLIDEENRRSIVAWSIFTAIFWCISLSLSPASSTFAACRSVYLTSLIISILTLLGALFLVPRYPRVLPTVIFLLLASVLGAGIWIAVLQPHVRTATMIAFAVIVPTCVIDSTLNDIILQLLTIVAYMVFGRNVIDPEIYMWGLTNLILYSIVGVLVGHVINKARAERYVYAESLRDMAEIQTRNAHYDQLTGMKNRRSYVEKLTEIEHRRPEDFCIIMADLNGLKSNNDTLGHDAGDELIIGASQCLTSAFSNTDAVFRIGGDEFCVIMEGTAEKARACVDTLNDLCARWEGKYVHGISISCGIASSQDSTDLHAIVKLADQRMYDEKRDYYARTGAVGR